MSIHNLGFRILGYYHRAQWRGAKTARKECWGRCHGLIPNLWDFAQNYSLQIELRNQNWRRFRQGNWAVHFERGKGPVCWVPCANMWASVKTSDVWFIISPVMRCQNRAKGWEISKAMPDSRLPSFSIVLSILIADKKAKNSRRRIPERYPMIPKNPKVQKATGNLKCWMVSRVNRGFWRPLMWQDCSLTAVQR